MTADYVDRADAEKDMSAAVDHQAEVAALQAALRSGMPGLLRKVLARINSLLSRSPKGSSLSWRVRRVVARSGLFDATWYRARYPDAVAEGQDPLSHYFRHGFAEGRFPNPLFDTRWYLTNHADVLASGVNPLLHYLRSGEKEGRAPNPLFDPVWYAARYPDVAGAGAGPLRHYLAHGSDEGRLPSPHFDPSLYLEANPDLLAAKQELLGHYLNHGRHEGRALAPTSIGSTSIGSTFQPGSQPAQLAYIPGDAAKGKAGRYAFAARTGAYTYIPPRRPDDLKLKIAGMRNRVLFSIITPVYNVDPLYLEKLVNSVEAQWYGDWELILVDDASSSPDTRSFLVNLRDSALRDDRFKVSLRTQNGGIAEATNSAIQLARGDYIVFLDHDDELTEDCLYELALRIDATEADYLYSDEDKVDQVGSFSAPFFKPDWSPDTFMSIMYTCHVSCIERDLLERVGRVRLGFDGAQDYDLILRVTEQARRIEHISKVLYHWRTLPTSIASDITAKPAAVGAIVRAKTDALARRGLQGRIEEVSVMPGQFSINYIPRSAALVSVIIPSKNNVIYLSRCIESLLEKTRDVDIELRIVDNGSSDQATLAYLARVQSELGIVVLRDDRAFNFSALNNTAARSAKGNYLLFLNDDTEIVSSDWLVRMVGFAELGHAGAVGAKLLYPDRRVQHCGVVNLAAGPGHAFLGSLPDVPRYFGRNILECNWLAVTGACMLVKKEKYDSVGGFDEEFPIAYNDVELCFRLWRAGFYSVVCQHSTLIHHESVSRGVDLSPAKTKRLREDWRRLYIKHPDLYMRDPFHSPHLGQGDVGFESFVF